MSRPRLRRQVAVGQRLNGVIIISNVSYDGVELHLPERLICLISRKGEADLKRELVVERAAAVV